MKEQNISDPAKGPERYLAVTDNWREKVDIWDEKLRARGMHIKKPVRVYKLTRNVESVEYRLEIEDL